MPKPAKRVTPKISQIKRFRDTARALGADQSEAAFNAALKKVAKAPPSKGSKSQPKEPGR